MENEISCSSSKVGSESKLLPQVDLQGSPSKNRNNVFDREKKKGNGDSCPSLVDLNSDRLYMHVNKHSYLWNIHIGTGQAGQGRYKMYGAH